MPPQNHVILREIVEVAIPRGCHARAVHAAFSRVLRNALPALVQRRCDELSRPDTIHRLETVEVDLGRLPLAELEGAFTHALETTLPVRLGEEIRRAEAEAGDPRVVRAAAHLERVGHFLRLGALPWWANRPDSGDLAESLRFLCRETPRDLVPFLRRWTQGLPSLRRLVRACGDDDLRDLLLLLRPDAAGWLGALLAALRELQAGPDRATALSSEQGRHQAWQSVLSAAASPTASAERDVFLDELIPRLGSELHLPAQALVAALSRQHERQPLRPESGFARFLDSARSAPRPLPPRLDDLSARLRAHTPPLDGLLAALGSSLNRFPAGLRADLDTLLTRFEPGALLPGDDLSRWLRAALAAGALPRRSLQLWLTQPGADRSSPARELRTLVGAALAAAPLPPEDRLSLAAAAEPPTSGFGFSDADAFYVDNSGLAILWPFLPPFFAHLGLIVEKQFPDEAARHRAVALLQFLLTQERTPPLEYFLPLNKVLCGLMPDALFEPGPPVSDGEHAECERFLAAVIEQAPILHHMSLPGFRGSFLARQGQLSTRDGAWLLRVERETHDVVLDQFPWSFQWVRLPWMPAPMFVEW